MLRAMRRVRLLSLAALIVIAGSVPTSLTVVMHDGSDDALHEPVLVQHDASAHRIGAANSPTDAPQHCPVCHWLQQLQTVVDAAGVVESVTSFQHHVFSSLPREALSLVGTLPARAPPVA